MISFKLKPGSKEQLTTLKGLFEKDLPRAGSISEYSRGVINKLDAILEKEYVTEGEIKVFLSGFTIGSPIHSLLQTAFEKNLGPSPSVLVFSGSPRRPLTPRIGPSPLRQSSTTPPRP